MRRICWDSNLLIYLLDDYSGYASRVEQLLEQSYEREDQLFLSLVGLGEVMAGAGKSTVRTTASEMRQAVDQMGFSYLPFEANAVDTFARLRSVDRVKTADAIHLASAAVARVDLFLTNDKRLLKLYVPGIHFIADFNTPLL